MKKLLNTDQLCEALGVSRPHIVLCRQCGMPVIPIGKNQVRYDYDEVIAWFRTNPLNERSVGA
jgi:predicted DNA-binding transcriptional regulator AlpA